jgi:tight adherence protein B
MSGDGVTPALPAQLAAAAATVAGVAGLRALAAARGPRVRSSRARLLGGREWAVGLAARLDRAGVPVSVEAFLVLVAGAAAAGGVVGWVVTGAPLVALLAVGGVGVAVRAFLGSVERRYAIRIAAQLPGVAQQLSSAVAAGLSLRQAITRAANDAPEPVAGELRRTAGELTLGSRVDEALDRLVERLPDPDLAIMVTAIIVQRRTGGNMARALADLARRLEERVALARELRGATAQARATAAMVAALPLVAGLLIEVAAPGVLGRTFGQGTGLGVLGIAIGLEAFGFVLIRKIARVET